MILHHKETNIQPKLQLAPILRKDYPQPLVLLLNSDTKP